jgi:hypothetical protein
VVAARTGIRRMKNIISIAVSLFFCFSALAQKNKVQEVTVYNAALQTYLGNNLQIKFIRFNKYVFENIEIFPDTSLTGSKNIPYENRYDLGYLGHLYLIEKKFGKFPYEEFSALVDSLADKKSEYSWFEGTITAKSLTIKITNSYPSNKKNRVFFKVPIYAEYPGGEKALTKHIQNNLAETQALVFPKTDTVILLKMIVRKSGFVENVQFIDSSLSAINSIIKAALMNSEKWKPAMQGGAWVSCYVEVFIRLRKDGSIEADYLY